MKLSNWFMWIFNFLLLLSAIILLSCGKIGEIGYIILVLSIAGLISVGKYIKLSIGGATLQVEDDDGNEDKKDENKQ